MNISARFVSAASVGLGLVFAASGVHKIALALSASGWSSTLLAVAEIASGLIIMSSVLRGAEPRPEGSR